MPHCCRYCGDETCDCPFGYYACQGCPFCLDEPGDEEADDEHDCGEDTCVCLDPD